ncbi:hypothetical protein KI387_021565 [Taxus chinensis]|uniref:Uncharacterized protein n=1 Tax=Taxus chinensis TaxID=29808 RepID=A0AA38GAX7_TAXCH|nr:hypothetical protein KI387_021565 [Taxus chinensis]
MAPGRQEMKKRVIEKQSQSRQEYYIILVVALGEQVYTGWGLRESNFVAWALLDVELRFGHKAIYAAAIACPEMTPAQIQLFEKPFKYGDSGMKIGTCTNRAESAALNTKSRSLFLQNFFPDNPDFPKGCKENYASLSSMLPVCYLAAGKRWANYLAVDFYKRSDGGGASEAVDKLNG